MRLAVVTPSISRDGGGLLDAVRRPAQQLDEMPRTEVAVFSLDDAHAAADAPQWAPVRVCTFPPRGPRSLGYAPQLPTALDAFGPDLVHLHGLWQHLSHVTSAWAGRTGRPYVITPHGMLDPWALRISAWKKRLAALLVERRALQGARCLHALCDAEADAIRSFGLRNPICVIPNGVDLPPRIRRACRADAGPRTMLFLGRLHPKKGLRDLLHAWAHIARDDARQVDGWTLVIAGWDQAGHAAALRELVHQLGLQAYVEFRGPTFGAEKAHALAEADAFVLPSLSEGLPMSVLEAWAHDLPVLMTTACNLPEGAANGAAVTSQTGVPALTRALSDFLERSDADRASMGAKGRSLVERQFTWPVVATALREVHAWAVDGGATPATIRIAG